jgi:hypothetical protein
MVSGARWSRRLGWVLSAVTLLFLFMDAIAKLLAIPVVVASGAALGLPGAGMARVLGALLAMCAILYAAPRTSVLGAILLTGYLGGAVAIHVRAGNPLFSHILFGVYVGAIAWAGLYLRDPTLQTLLPVAKAKAT